jgi:hypothetical protein
MKQKPPDVRLSFRALPDPDRVPANVRYRRLLKFALRTLRLRCVAVEDLVHERFLAAAAAGPRNQSA